MGIGLFQKILDLVDLVGCINGNQNRTDLSGRPEGNEPGRNIGSPNSHMVARLNTQGNQSSGAFIHITAKFGISTCIIQSRIFEGILIGIIFHHGIQHIGESSLDNIILFPHKGTGLVTVIIGLIIFFFITAQRSNIIGKVSQHDIGIIHLVVPGTANIAIIVQRSQSIDHLIHRQITLTDQYGMIILHIAQAHIFNVGTQFLNRSLCTLSGTEEGAANVPGCAQYSRRKEINDVGQVFGFSQIAHRLQQNLYISLFSPANGRCQLLFQQLIGKLFFHAHDHALNAGASGHIHIAHQHIGGHFFALHRLRHSQSRYRKTTIQKLALRIRCAVITQHTIHMLTSFFQRIVDLKTGVTIVVGISAHIQKGCAVYMFGGKYEFHFKPPRIRSYSKH